MTMTETTIKRTICPEFYAVMPGDVIQAPFWPVPVTVEAAVQQDARFVLVHWSAPGMSGVSLLSEHSLVRIMQRWDPDLCGRYEPREVPAAAVLGDAVRKQHVRAGITGRRDSAEKVQEWAVESDLAAMSVGEQRTEQPCGCWR